MKYLIAVATMVVSLFGWEVNTHRAIDRKAIKSSANLKSFIENSKIDKNYTYINELFLTYGMSYEKYIKVGEENGISQWKQEFKGKDNIQDIIEAGTILEDAVWAGGLFSGDGRFNNHFYDPQNGGKSLSFGWGSRTNAVSWAKNNMQEEV